jgi:hypothetical protein
VNTAKTGVEVCETGTVCLCFDFTAWQEQPKARLAVASHPYPNPMQQRAPAVARKRVREQHLVSDTRIATQLLKLLF